jgi:hypothetical protein
MSLEAGAAEPGGRRIIPLMVGPAAPNGERRAALRSAVMQVVRDLVIERVPAEQRSPHFDQALALLDVAGWGLDELLEAAGEGPARDRLLRAAGLAES